MAREILARRPDARLVVIDKQDAVAQHQTGHNSGVIHSGIYYTPGSLKARLCVEGARLMYEYCDEHAIPYERCGKLVVALDDAELPRLDELEARARANGVPGLRRVTAAEIREIEPEARGVSALHSPETGIVDFGEVARTMERELRGKGVDFALGREVTGVRRVGSRTVVECRDGAFRGGLGGPLRRPLVRPAGRRRPAPPRIRGSCRSAVPTCAWPTARRPSYAA